MKVWKPMPGKTVWRSPRGGKRRQVAEAIEIARDAFTIGKEDEAKKIIAESGARVARCIRKTSSSPKLNQALYEIYGGGIQGYTDARYDRVVVSASTQLVIHGDPPETYIFPAKGNDGDFHRDELQGSQRGTLSHRKVLNDAGIDYIIPCEGVPLTGTRARRKRKR